MRRPPPLSWSWSLLASTAAVLALSAPLLGCGGTDAASVPEIDAGSDGATDAGVDATPDAAGCGAGTQDKDRDGVCSAACTDATCSGHGTCDDGSGTAICTCTGGFAGTTCAACGAGLQDKDKNGTCTPACTSDTCSAHGVCSDTSGTATCACDPAYTGASCTACAPGAQDHDGNGTCTIRCSTTTCSGHGICSDSSGSAVCTCSGGYDGPTCAACAAGTQDNDGDGQCAPACASDTCTGSGTCDDSTGAIACTCDATHAGDRCEFRLLYDLDIAANARYKNGSQIPYTTDARADVLAYDRIAYRLQLDDDWVWAEMDPFSTDPGDLGVPSDLVLQQAVTNLTVKTNSANVTPVTTPGAGAIAFWPDCYGPSGTGFGSQDVIQTWRPRCYGSMRVFDASDRTVFAFNRWAEGGTSNVDLGVGLAPSGSKEWTFAVNGGTYTTRNLRVYVREMHTCAGGACTANQSNCSEPSGTPVCACDSGFGATGCGHVCEGEKHEVACTGDEDMGCDFYAKDGYDSVGCAGSTASYCNFTDTGCTTNGCVENLTLTYDFGKDVALDKVRFQSDWWTKRPKDWEVWTSDSPSDTPGAGATLAFQGTAHTAPFICVTGDPCTDEVPDACCPNGRNQNQDTVNVGTMYPKWDEGDFTPVTGRYWYVVVKNSYAPQSVLFRDIAFYGDDCVP